MPITLPYLYNNNTHDANTTQANGRALEGHIISEVTTNDSC